jgi:hypothetical protein
MVGCPQGSTDIGNCDVAVYDSERELHTQAGPGPTRAVEKNPAADRLHAVFDAISHSKATMVG